MMMSAYAKKYKDSSGGSSGGGDGGGIISDFRWLLFICTIPITLTI